jgi:2-oxoglutarate ferredoxin oxidoreductase subunit alpha
MSPQSPQEAFDLTIDAFNLSERYRVPVMFLMDECVGHMTERVVIPEADEIEVVPRHLTTTPRDEFLPYRLNGGQIPEFARAGDGYRFHATGLTHDERGYPVMSIDCQEKCVRRLLEKITDNADDIVRFEEEQTEGADVVVVTYGITARVARLGIDMAREKGIKVGSVRLVVIWPFAEKRIRELAGSVGALVVPEINYGQLVLEVERCAAGKCDVWPVPHGGGGVHDPADIAEIIIKAAK